MAKIADVGMVRSQVAELVTAQPVLTPLWAAPEVLRRERASVKVRRWARFVYYAGSPVPVALQSLCGAMGLSCRPFHHSGDQPGVL